MKRTLAWVCAMILLLSATLSFASCSKKPASDSGEKADSDYVKEKGKLVVGITEFKPMDYKDENGTWIGFDADLAKEFAKYLGVEADFVLIDWDNKAMELSGKSIDCVWNGMTLNDEVRSAMSCTDGYCNNAQIVIVQADKAADYATVEACKDLRFAVESGSTGMTAAQENGFTYTEVQDQATALMEVASGTCDAAIIDSIMAAAMVGEGTSYATLAYTVGLTTELYGVGFRLESDLTAKWGEFFEAIKKDGTLTRIAEQYGVQAALVD